MAIERMKLLSVVGKEDTLNKFISEYLLNSGIQLEEAHKVYEKGWNLSSYSYNFETKEVLKRCKNMLDCLNINYSEDFAGVELKDNEEDIKKYLETIEKQIEESEERANKAKENIENLEKTILPVSKLKNIGIDLQELYDLKYIKFRYGRIPKEYYENLKKELSSKEAILLEIDEDAEYKWLMYFTTEDFDGNVDSYFNVRKFERTWIPSEVVGKPKEAINHINKTILINENIIKKENMLKEQLEKANRSELLYMYRELQTLVKINSIKKYLTHDKEGNFYIIGWMPVDELKNVTQKLSKDDSLQYEVKSYDEVATNPPTHLKNGKIISKFESIVEMYGVPNYTETDPTLFVAITTFLMFGFMFGDVGQGFVIAIIGLILSKCKKSLGPILVAGGISAISFGFIYGSIFGKEGIIPSLLISPMEDITTMLISGIACGAVLIIISMFINIKNGIMQKDKMKIFFSKNGLAGLAFYGIILLSIVYYFLKGKMILPIGALVAIVIVLLAIIMFKDSLENLIEKKKENTKSSIIEKIFEIIEMLLSTASNTISFVRLAAFAINHAGLCMAVYILSNMASGTGSIAVSIIGNGLVIVLEGVIVAIQVLRLEYYELFSRFYDGNGRKYRPIKDEIDE